MRWLKNRVIRTALDSTIERLALGKKISWNGLPARKIQEIRYYQLEYHGPTKILVATVPGELESEKSDKLTIDRVHNKVYLAQPMQDFTSPVPPTIWLDTTQGRFDFLGIHYVYITTLKAGGVSEADSGHLLFYQKDKQPHIILMFETFYGMYEKGVRNALVAHDLTGSINFT